MVAKFISTLLPFVTLAFGPTVYLEPPEGTDYSHVWFHDTHNNSYELVQQDTDVWTCPVTMTGGKLYLATCTDEGCSVVTRDVLDVQAVAVIIFCFFFAISIAIFSRRRIRNV